MLSVAEQQKLSLEEAANVSLVLEAERPVGKPLEIPMDQPLEPHVAEQQKQAVAEAHNEDGSDYIERVLYQPPDPDWKQKEEALLDELRIANEKALASLEPEPPGVNDVLTSTDEQVGEVGRTLDAVRGAGLEEEALQLETIASQMQTDVSGAAKQASALAQQLQSTRPDLAANVETIATKLSKLAEDEALGGQVSVGQRGDLKKGYDLVRWGNIEGVAIFHFRTEELLEPRQELFREVVNVLREICVVFDYNPCYVTLFWQPHSVSRFIQQKLLFNVSPL